MHTRIYQTLITIYRNPFKANIMRPLLHAWNIEVSRFRRLLVYIFLVGVAMHTHAVECYKGVLELSLAVC